MVLMRPSHKTTTRCLHQCRRPGVPHLDGAALGGRGLRGRLHLPGTFPHNEPCHAFFVCWVNETDVDSGTEPCGEVEKDRRESVCCQSPSPPPSLNTHTPVHNPMTSRTTPPAPPPHTHLPAQGVREVGHPLRVGGPALNLAHDPPAGVPHLVPQSLHPPARGGVPAEPAAAEERVT